MMFKPDKNLMEDEIPEIQGKKKKQRNTTVKTNNRRKTQRYRTGSTTYCKYNTEDTRWDSLCKKPKQ